MGAARESGGKNTTGFRAKPIMRRGLCGCCRFGLTAA
jgi:hypothetical protein